MAAQCPLCHASIPDDFGLIECPECAAPLIVHMDGRVEFSGSTAPDAAEESAPEPEPVAELSEDAVPSPEPVFDFGAAANDSEPETTPPPPESAVESTAAAAEQAPQPSTEYNFDAADDQVVEHYGVASPTAASASGGLSEIAQFGNSDSSAAQDGTLRYTVTIAGIDTVDMREEFREAITDRKLVWDADAILRQVRNGEIHLPPLSAVKAHLVITRLRHLPVQIRWEQHAITQS